MSILTKAVIYILLALSIWANVQFCRIGRKERNVVDMIERARYNDDDAVHLLPYRLLIGGGKFDVGSSARGTTIHGHSALEPALDFILYSHSHVSSNSFHVSDGAGTVAFAMPNMFVSWQYGGDGLCSNVIIQCNKRKAVHDNVGNGMLCRRIHLYSLEYERIYLMEKKTGE